MKNNITYVSRNAELANEIYDTMSDKEKEYVTGGDNRSWYVQQKDFDKENSIIVYSSLSLKNNIPISFLDVYNIDGIGEISIGVRNTERGKGYAIQEILKLLSWYEHNKKDLTLSWCVNINNKASINLAKKFNFKRDYKRDFDKNWLAYKL